MTQTLTKPKKSSEPFQKNFRNTKKQPPFYLALGVVRAKFARIGGTPKLKLEDGSKLDLVAIDSRFAVWMFSNIDILANPTNWLVYPQKTGFQLKACNAELIEGLELNEFYVAGAVSKDQKSIFVGRNSTHKRNQYNFIKVEGLPQMPVNSPIAIKAKLENGNLKFIELKQVADLKRVAGVLPDQNRKHQLS